MDVGALLKHTVSFYVCGDAANMAKDVHGTLTLIIAENENITEKAVQDKIKAMRCSSRYQVCGPSVVDIRSRLTLL